MNKKLIKFSTFLLAGYFFSIPRLADAVIPPDFIFNIGAQVAQFFSIIIIFFTAVFGAFFQFLKTRFYTIKHKRIFLVFFVFFVVSVSLLSSYFYATYRQKVEYQKWLEESKAHNIIQKDDNQSGGNNNLGGLDRAEDLLSNVDENDQLNIGDDSNKNIDTSASKFVSKISESDDSARFIGEYYGNIANGNLEQAYAMSKKTVDATTFKGWYLKTTKITLDRLVRIDAKKSSIELTLYEGGVFTRYGVLMTLTLQGTMPVKVEKSEVKILAQGSVSDEKVSINENVISAEYGFFASNEKRNIFVTNQEFKDTTNSEGKDYVVLDARENIEYENGYFPGSVHIRFADLKAGRWIELPKDKFVYVICWSGIRGKEVAEFLRTKKIVSVYLENGANGWVEFGGKWTGSIKFVEKYDESRYQVIFNTDEIKNKVRDGVILVDTREPYKFKQWHIAGSVGIPMMYTPTIEIEKVFGQVSPKSKIITVCDGYVNCFDAKITGVELERRGNQFLGRYNKPWEYEKE